MPGCVKQPTFLVENCPPDEERRDLGARSDIIPLSIATDPLFREYNKRTLSGVELKPKRPLFLAHGVTLQAEAAATYGAKRHTASPCCSAVRLVHATLVRATPRSRPSRDRFAPVQASPALCPCETRRPPRVNQAVPYGARAYTRSLSPASSESCSPQIRCVRTYKIR